MVLVHELEDTMNVALFPPEVILLIFSYLDLPELDVIGHVSPVLKRLAQDPALHRVRIRVVAPARIQHFLFAHGGNLRPSVGDLVQWNVFRGLGIERRWRMGAYLYSPQSVRQYENSQRLEVTHVRRVLSTHLQRRRATTAAAAAQSVMPDAEFVSSPPSIAKSLLPVLHKLKWCIRRDKFARMVRATTGMNASVAILGRWDENERIRLAICPGIRKIVKYYEGLASQ
ncbi:hypothetical protein SCHPADRAFT_947223 [Schizopora paradoxa]|uniref:F-box domain-containing protein n=1 Tax=Schizopora paradoxa TaxID=27342 RepID=A0A0H2R043_9AGAM|nr:hypothetical protein SCHPADRAFT_947223 [Schizopora paradoxa]